MKHKSPRTYRRVCPEWRRQNGKRTIKMRNMCRLRLLPRPFHLFLAFAPFFPSRSLIRRFLFFLEGVRILHGRIFLAREREKKKDKGIPNPPPCFSRSALQGNKNVIAKCPLCSRLVLDLSLRTHSLFSKVPKRIWGLYLFLIFPSLPAIL